ncbi:hypothetical protein BGX27_010478 [Mortierella sp. AM989]|nr:hypothetical protein BGX27_010478 [Mortierella sp. AM989]
MTKYPSTKESGPRSGEPDDISLDKNIALIIDNVRGQDTSDLQLNKIKIIRLPPETPKTTSIIQPLNAEIIRSFKVKYSRLMLQAILRHRHSAELLNSKIPNGEFWACLAPAWNAVTTRCIRNSFATVPIILKELRRRLRTTEDDIEEETEKLKEELKSVYPERADAIIKEEDFEILLYLQSCQGKGPSQIVSRAVKEIITSEKFKNLFVSPGDVKIVNEDSDSDDNDSTDEDYIPASDATDDSISGDKHNDGEDISNETDNGGITEIIPMELHSGK